MFLYAKQKIHIFYVLVLAEVFVLGFSVPCGDYNQQYMACAKMFATSKTVSVAPCLSPTKFIVSSTLLHSNVFQLFPTTRCKKTWNTSSFGRVVVVPSALCIWSKAPATHLSHSCTTNSSPALFFTTTLFLKIFPPPLDNGNTWIMTFSSAPNILWARQTLTTIPLGNKTHLQWKKSTITTSLCPDV